MQGRRKVTNIIMMQLLFHIRQTRTATYFTFEGKSTKTDFFFNDYTLRQYSVHMACQRLFQLSTEISEQPKFNKRTCGGQVQDDIAFNRQLLYFPDYKAHLNISPAS